MKDDPLRSLLEDIAPEPPRSVDVDALVTEARRHQARRRTTLLGVAAAVVAVALGSFVLLGARTAQVAVPAGGPSATASGSAAAGGPDAPGRCPALRPGTDDASADYIDLLVWQEQTYVSTPRRAPREAVGQQVTTVGCSVDELTRKNHQLVEPMPWPDRTATFLPSGTPVHALQDVQARCAVAVEQGGVVVVYAAVDLESPDQRPVCPAESLPR